MTDLRNSLDRLDRIDAQLDDLQACLLRVEKLDATESTEAMRRVFGAGFLLGFLLAALLAWIA